MILPFWSPCLPTILNKRELKAEKKKKKQMSQLLASGGQRIEVSASTSVLLMNTQD